MKKIIYVVLILFLCASCLTRQTKRAKISTDKQKQQQARAAALKIGVLPTLDCLPLFIAKEQGMYRALHTDVRLVEFTAQMDADTAIMGTSVEGMVSDLIRTERLQHKQHLPLQYITATGMQWQLISNKKARIKQLNQLGDKMIAMTRYSATDYLTDQALKGVKTKAQVFRVQINDVHIRLQMLLNNEMDAMWLPQPQATTAKLYHHRIINTNQVPNIQLGVIAFSTHKIKSKQRQLQVKAFIKAYNRAVDSINTHGIQHYLPIIIKYCGTNEQTVKALPSIKYQQVQKPKQKDIDMAKQYIKGII